MTMMNDDILEKVSALLDGELGDFETRQLLKQIDQLQPEQRDAVYASWQRMQLTSDLLQGESSLRGLDRAALGGGLLSAVSQAIADERPVGESVTTAPDLAQSVDAGSERAAQQPLAQAAAVGASDTAQLSHAAETHDFQDQGADEKQPAPLWSKMAMAASVALAVIVGVQQLQISDQNDRLLVAEQSRAVSPQLSPALASAAGAESSEQAVLMAEIESAASMQEQLQAQRRLIDYLSARQHSPAVADPFARVANFADQAEAAPAPSSSAQPSQ